ncbi:MAG: RlmF-related methyltransferase [Candidatus Hodarchaeales archaeon]|jgi:methylase of polypeptide subunit release factors
MNKQSFLTKKCGVPIKQALKLDSNLTPFVQNGKLDLGNTTALLLYNKLILKEFMDLDFDIPEGYLIPTICSRWAFLKHILQFKPLNILEIGTGASGILSLMLGRLGLSVTATEIDEEAIQSAHSNIQRNKLSEHISLIKSNTEIILGLLSQLSDFDLIFCNPPQYDENYYRQHKTSMRGFVGNYSELVGGEKGHEFILTLLSEVKTFPAPPPVFFQLTLPHLKPLLEEELNNQGYEYKITSNRVGTRTRLYFQVKF